MLARSLRLCPSRRERKGPQPEENGSDKMTATQNQDPVDASDHSYEAGRPPTRGKCRLCGSTYTKRGMTKHLSSCRERHFQKYPVKRRPETPTMVFHLEVVASESSFYWLHFDVFGPTTLEELDRYLRGIWLECCGHLSMFEIRDISYSISPSPDLYQTDMNVKLEAVVKEGYRFKYRYDLGSTTALDLRVLDVRFWYPPPPSKKVTLLARNIEPEIPCEYCHERATFVCCFCRPEAGWVCKDCRQRHLEDCIADMSDPYHPILNSPRSGVCGYIGERFDWLGHDPADE